MQREGATVIKSLAEPIMIFSTAAEEKMKRYITKMGSVEIGWLGFVDKLDETTYYLTDVFVPFQDVSGGTCEMREEELNEQMFALIMQDEDKYNSIRLWGHSHHSMGVTPSGQDDLQFTKFIGRWQDEPINPFFIRLIANNKGIAKVDLYDNLTKLRFDNIACHSERLFDDEFYASIDAEIEANTRKIEPPKAVPTNFTKGNAVTHSGAKTDSNSTKSTTTKTGTKASGSKHMMICMMSMQERVAVIGKLLNQDPEIMGMFTTYTSVGNVFTSQLMQFHDTLESVTIATPYQGYSQFEQAKACKDFMYAYSTALHKAFSEAVDTIAKEVKLTYTLDDASKYPNKKDYAYDMIREIRGEVYDVLYDNIVKHYTLPLEGYDTAESFMDSTVGRVTELLLLCELMHNNAEMFTSIGLGKNVVQQALKEFIADEEYPIVKEMYLDLPTVTTSFFKAVTQATPKKKHNKKQPVGGK